MSLALEHFLAADEDRRRKLERLGDELRAQRGRAVFDDAVRAVFASGRLSKAELATLADVSRPTLDRILRDAP